MTETILIVGSDNAFGRAVAEHFSASTIIRLDEQLHNITFLKQQVEKLKQAHDTIDYVFFCHREKATSQWTTTKENVERAFAYNYVSRHIISYGLGDRITKAVVSIHRRAKDETVYVRDLELKDSYQKSKANTHIRRLMDLWAVHFHEKHGVLTIGFDPGTVKERASFFTALFAKPAAVAFEPLWPLLEEEPSIVLVNGSERIDTTDRAYHPGKAYEVFMETSRKLVVAQHTQNVMQAKATTTVAKPIEAEVAETEEVTELNLTIEATKAADVHKTPIVEANETANWKQQAFRQRKKRMQQSFAQRKPFANRNKFTQRKKLLK